VRGRGGPEKKANPFVPFSEKHKLSPILLLRYRRAKVWLQPNLLNLEAAGWTRKALFRIGTLSYPYGWGAAWSSLWGEETAIPHLTTDGDISWTILGVHRNAVQVMRPEAYL
jgi:hypothetical protein